MPIELRILSGAHAGQVKRFEQAVVVVGRQAGLDLRFDPQQDLDVSARHAEIRSTEAGYLIHDTGSTNGTYVNGQKVVGSKDLKDGDKIRFGAKGPEAEVQLSLSDAEALRRTATRSTEQRIAIAVTEQTAGIKRAMIAAGVILVLGAGGGLYYAKSQSTQRTEAFAKLIADNERMRISLQSSMRESGDTALVNEIQRNVAALQKRLTDARSAADSTTIRAEIQENEAKMRRMVSMDLPTIFRQNAPGVAILISEIGGKSFSGTGFSISTEGHIITNRHNVQVDGTKPTRIAVKFTETGDWLPAHVVKVADNPDDDIALIQVDREGPFPVVAGVSASATDATEGMSVVSIGYPLGYDTPMEGPIKNFIAKATLNPGTVSKTTSTVLQIDSYATHGSSGSPVFSTRGHVVGLIYGGAREAGGKIVYAVPPARIAAFIPAELKSIVKE
jgi:S1-C subfamily serine protease